MRNVVLSCVRVCAVRYVHATCSFAERPVGVVARKALQSSHRRCCGESLRSERKAVDEDQAALTIWDSCWSLVISLDNQVCSNGPINIDKKWRLRLTRPG